jgi:hypothetical protein
MSSPSARRRALRVWAPAALVGVLLSSGLVVPVADAGASGVEWVVPVSGSVVSAFREPVSRYGAGHRGVDFAAATGTPVKAANDGQVAFAGTVAGGLHVVVGHGGGIRTSYSFLSSVAVTQGQRVRRGQVVGTAGGSGDGHSPGVLHFGVRIGERYVDPMLLFRPPDLTEMVRLVPAAERAASDVTRMTRAEAERRAKEMLEDSFGHSLVDDAAEVVDEGVEWVGKGVAGGVEAVFVAGIDVLAEAGEAADRLVRRLARPLHDLLEVVKPVTDFVKDDVLPYVPGGPLLADVLEIGERAIGALAMNCDHGAPPANGRRGSGNAVVMVGGFDSHRRKLADREGRATRSFDLPIESLGYDERDVHTFSYNAGSATYSKQDTHQHIKESARILAEQLRQWKRENPGRSFDLIAHSQGGVVVLAFLAFFYVGHESEFPPIASIVTFASPLEGVPMSTEVDDVHDTTSGASILWTLQRALGGVMESALAPSVLDLAEDSELMEQLDDFEVPASINWTSIMGTLDPVVVANAGDHAGVDREIPVTVGDAFNPLDDHTGIVRDSDALAVARAGIEGRDPPCQSLGTIAVGAAARVAIARLEHTAGELVARGLASPIDPVVAPLVP